MSEPNPGKPGTDEFAFPKPDCPQLHAQTGMTLRDWFAGLAMTGLLMTNRGVSREDIAVEAYRQADSMIGARSA